MSVFILKDRSATHREPSGETWHTSSWIGAARGLRYQEEIVFWWSGPDTLAELVNRRPGGGPVRGHGAARTAAAVVKLKGPARAVPPLLSAAAR